MPADGLAWLTYLGYNIMWISCVDSYMRGEVRLCRISLTISENVLWSAKSIKIFSTWGKFEQNIYNFVANTDPADHLAALGARTSAATVIHLFGSNHYLKQCIAWTNYDLLEIGLLGTNFSKIWIKIETFSFKKMYLKIPTAKSEPFSSGRNVLNSNCIGSAKYIGC